MSADVDLGAAYAYLRNEIEAWTAKLGASDFSRVAVAIAAREALQRHHVDVSTNWRVRSNMPFCEPFAANASELRSAARGLAQVFAIREERASAVGELVDGRLAIRGMRLYFETAHASVLMGHCYPDSFKKDSWVASSTKDAEFYLEFRGLPRPKVSITHTKSEDAALKALHRIAKQHFGVDLAAPVDEALATSTAPAVAAALGASAL